MTSIRTADGWRYGLSEGDLVWLGRAADAEGGDPADTIWTWLQRLTLPNFRRMTLSELVQGHSQAVSPAWMEDGTFCRPGGQYAGTDYCSPARLTRRATNRAKSPSDWRASTQQAIAALRAGRLANPVPRSVDFAAPSVADPYLERHPDARVVARRNGGVYIAYPESLRWPDGYVQLEGGLGLSTWLALVGVGSAAVVGLGWWFWGKR